MEFDLSSFPANSTVLGAFLSLSASGPIGAGTVGQVGSMGQNNAKLFRITSAWNDNTVTWNTQPTFTMVSAVPLAPSTYAMQNYINIDVTTLVQDMVTDPSNSFGFLLKEDNEIPSRGLCSFGGLAPDPDKVPQLVIVYGDCGQTGIAEEDGDDNTRLLLSPSIASPGSVIHLEMSGTAGLSTLDLIDALGQSVLTRTISSWPVCLTLPALAQGSYTWRSQNTKGILLGTARMVVR